jgi:hypothetical protein
VIVLKAIMHQRLPGDIRRARSAGQAVVYDLDDNIWAGPAPNEPAWNVGHVRAALAVCNLVTVSTPRLAAITRGFGVQNVSVLANAIDLRDWTRQPVKPQVETLGWLRDSQGREKDLAEAALGVRRFLEPRRQIRFVTVKEVRGAPVPRKVLRLPPTTRIEARAQVLIPRLPELWRGVDIGIAPLANTTFNASKSAILVMEGAGAGVPMVASDALPFREYGHPCRVRQGEHWSDVLAGLLDYERRVELEAAQWERVQKEDLSVRWRDWADVYEQAQR